MKTRTLKQLLLYNYRYRLAYLVVIGFTLYFLGWQLSQVAPGLSEPELDTAVRHLSLREIINLPIYPLQATLEWISLKLLGVTTLSLRLPSVLIAGATVIGLYALLKRLFGRATALLSTAIFVSADWFLFVARLGVGAVELSFWLVWTLFAITKLIERRNGWLIFMAFTLGGLSFAPFGILASLTILSCLVAFGLFRQRILEISWWIQLLSGLIILSWLGILAAVGFRNSEFIKSLFGIQQELPNFVEYGKNVVVNTAGIIGVLPTHNPLLGPSGVFFVRFFELVFALFGAAMLWRGRINRLYLTLFVISIVLALTSGLSSGARGGSLIIIPATVFITAGVRHFVHRWQRTFPKNPYARITGFVPLALLFVLVVGFHYQSYFTLWPNQLATRNTFSTDYQLLKTELDTPESSKSCVVVGASNTSQRLITFEKPRCQIRFATSIQGLDPSDRLITSPGVNLSSLTQRNHAKHALVNDLAENNVRWIVVEPAN